MKQYECIHCWIDVEKIKHDKNAKKWGTGELPKWKHVAAKDEHGHPNCGRVLKDEDVATVTGQEA